MKLRAFRRCRRLLLLVAIALAVVPNGTAFADDSVSVTLNSVNNSGVSGAAQLIARGNQTEVIVSESGEPAGVSEPAHIHEGPCDSLNPKPTFPLRNVENGESDTVVNAPLSSVANGRYVINVHQSAANIGTYVACGAIPLRLSPPSEAVWTAGTSMSSKRSSLGAAVASDGSIYAVGGSIADSEYPALVERFDPTTRVWTRVASLPTARYDLGVVTGPDGKIYAIGGCCDRDALATVEAFDPTSNSWTARADLPTARRSLGVVLASNGKIYAIGGSTNGKDYLDTVEEYDPATNTWTSRAGMPTPRGELGVVATPNGKIYAIGGITNNRQYLATVEEYDVASDTWTTKVSMPTPRGSLGVVREASGKILAIGGANTGHEEMSTVEEYDPVSNSWTTLAHLTTARSGFATAVGPDGAIYVIGGCCDSDGNFLSTVEVGTLTTSPAAPSPTQLSTAASPTAVPTATTTTRDSVVQSASTQTAKASAIPTAPPASQPTSVVVGVPITDRASLQLTAIILVIVFVGALVVAAVVLLTRRSASPATSAVAAPAGSVPPGSPPSDPAPHMGVSTTTPSPSPVPAVVAWHGGPSTSPPSTPYPPPPAQPWTPPPVPSPWPPPFAQSNSAAPTVFGWNGGQLLGSDGLPGGYQIVGPPKSGGMASVFKAYQPALDRYVALKVMSPTLTNDPVFVQRFYDEALRTAKLEHPNIVPIYDIGQTPNGALFIAMRWVDGLSLQELLLHEHPLDHGRAARIAIQVADALDHAHGWGIIHRDVKPSNVMVEHGDRVTLMDFGIAKLIGDSQLTRDGAIVGTPRYLSPEQALGKPADHRSDIYALGVVLYEMLTGRTPFEADTPTAMLHAHTSLPPPPTGDLNRAIPTNVAAVVLRALAKSPAERYQSAREFGLALRAVISVSADEI